MKKSCPDLSLSNHGPSLYLYWLPWQLGLPPSLPEPPIPWLTEKITLFWSRSEFANWEPPFRAWNSKGKVRIVRRQLWLDHWQLVLMSTHWVSIHSKPTTVVVNRGDRHRRGPQLCIQTPAVYIMIHMEAPFTVSGAWATTVLRKLTPRRCEVVHSVWELLDSFTLGLLQNFLAQRWLGDNSTPAYDICCLQGPNMSPGVGLVS